MSFPFIAIKYVLKNIIIVFIFTVLIINNSLFFITIISAILHPFVYIYKHIYILYKTYPTTPGNIFSV